MFGLLLAGRPVITEFQTVSPTELSIAIPSSPHFSHVVIFLLPGQQLPAGAAAAVFARLPSSTDFTFLGAVANEKPSAIFRVRDGAIQGGLGQVEADAPAGEVTIGISVQEIAAVQQLLASQQQLKIMPAKDLAKKIMLKAYNFLTSFADSSGRISLTTKAFDDLWNKFEKKIEHDPEYLNKT